MNSFKSILIFTLLSRSFYSQKNSKNGSVIEKDEKDIKDSEELRIDINPGEKIWWKAFRIYSKQIKHDPKYEENKIKGFKYNGKENEEGKNRDFVFFVFYDLRDGVKDFRAAIFINKKNPQIISYPLELNRDRKSFNAEYKDKEELNKKFSGAVHIFKNTKKRNKDGFFILEQTKNEAFDEENKKEDKKDSFKSKLHPPTPSILKKDSSSPKSNKSKSNYNRKGIIANLSFKILIKEEKNKLVIQVHRHKYYANEFREFSENELDTYQNLTTNLMNYLMGKEVLLRIDGKENEEVKELLKDNKYKDPKEFNKKISEIQLRSSTLSEKVIDSLEEGENKPIDSISDSNNNSARQTNLKVFSNADKNEGSKISPEANALPILNQEEDDVSNPEDTSVLIEDNNDLGGSGYIETQQKIGNFDEERIKPINNNPIDKNTIRSVEQNDDQLEPDALNIQKNDGPENPDENSSNQGLKDGEPFKNYGAGEDSEFQNLGVKGPEVKEKIFNKQKNEITQNIPGGDVLIENDPAIVDPENPAEELKKNEDPEKKPEEKINNGRENLILEDDINGQYIGDEVKLLGTISNENPKSGVKNETQPIKNPDPNNNDLKPDNQRIEDCADDENLSKETKNKKGLGNREGKEENKESQKLENNDAKESDQAQIKGVTEKKPSKLAKTLIIGGIVIPGILVLAYFGEIYLPTKINKKPDANISLEIIEN